MAFEIDHLLHHQRVDVTEITGNRLDAWLADTPWGIKGRGCVLPKKVMLGVFSAPYNSLGATIRLS